MLYIKAYLWLLKPQQKENITRHFPVYIYVHVCMYIICCLSPFPSTPPFHFPPLGGTTSAPPPSSGSRGTFHPSLHSDTEVDILQSRAHLIIRMIQLKIGQDLLLQVFNKLLTLASAGSQTLEWSLWQNLIISTGGVSPSHKSYM